MARLPTGLWFFASLDVLRLTMIQIPNRTRKTQLHDDTGQGRYPDQNSGSRPDIIDEQIVLSSDSNLRSVLLSHCWREKIPERRLCLHEMLSVSEAAKYG